MLLVVLTSLLIKVHHFSKLFKFLWSHIINKNQKAVFITTQKVSVALRSTEPLVRMLDVRMLVRMLHLISCLLMECAHKTFRSARVPRSCFGRSTCLSLLSIYLPNISVNTQICMICIYVSTLKNFCY